MDAASRSELPRHLDWAEFQEQLLAWALRRMRNTLDQVGFGPLPPTVHNFPPGKRGRPATPRACRLNMIGLDYYHQITPNDVRTIMRRTTELTARAAVTKTCSFSSEMGIGAAVLAPFSENDSLVTLVSALAFGLRGFNLYMAIDRDRWIGGAIERHGRERSVAKFAN